MAGLTADAEAFLARLVRLDPAALVRLRPTGAAVELWARLPWEVLVTRQVAAVGGVEEDMTVRAAALLEGVSSDRRDLDWRWRLPPGVNQVVERIPSGEIRRVGVAAERTLREAGATGVGGRAVGERALREALLDHVPIVVEVEGNRVEVPQRLVQAVLRMGFLGTGTGPSEQSTVAVRIATGWVGLAAGYGTAWRQIQSPFIVRTIR